MFVKSSCAVKVERRAVGAGDIGVGRGAVLGGVLSVVKVAAVGRPERGGRDPLPASARVCRIHPASVVDIRTLQKLNMASLAASISFLHGQELLCRRIRNYHSLKS
jgi:hypothetical protein